MLIKVTQYQSAASTLLRPLLRKHILFVMSFLMVVFSSPLHAQNNITVRGRVTNESGQGTPGASLTVKGGTTGTSSGENGNFEITTPANGTLVISSINYAPKEVSVMPQRITVQAGQPMRALRLIL